jgi:hypothetical protein
MTQSHVFMQTRARTHTLLLCVRVRLTAAAVCLCARVLAGRVCRLVSSIAEKTQLA